MGFGWKSWCFCTRSSRGLGGSRNNGEHKAMEMKYELKSGIEVGYRQFRPKDTTVCSQILVENAISEFRLLGRFGEWEHEITRVYAEEGSGGDSEEGFGNGLPGTVKRREFRVATLEDRPVGVMGFRRYTHLEGELSSLSVDPRFHGKGIGKLLISLETLRQIQRGIRIFHAYSGERSRRIFLRLGFSVDPTLWPGRLEDSVVPLSSYRVERLKLKSEELLREVMENET